MAPLGITLSATGADVAVSAPHAEAIELCVFDGGRETRHELTPEGNGRHVGHVDGLTVGDRYGLRAHGPWDPSQGLRHDPGRLLLDPFARAVSGAYVDHPDLESERGPETGRDTAPYVPRGVAVEVPPAPRPGPSVPWVDTVIYETHVKGLTMAHPEVEPGLRGTYLGAASQPIIDHLKRLGVTTVELMPVAHHVSEPFLQRKERTNYWGYSTLAWFAPHAGYATGDDGRQLAEFATMVDRFHAAGLEVIVDVVFNHTAEGGQGGPILSMKGLDNPGWYRLGPEDASRYVDWTGTGNTIDTGNEMVRAAIKEALRWWAEGLGVDGFRFDLAVTLGRADGPFHAANLSWLTDDPVIGALKLIAEPWDLGPDGYQLARFGAGWAEWNGRYRDDIRDVWRGRGSRTALAEKVAGSPHLLGDRGPLASVNFVTAHDGFTLADLVSYDYKHNRANQELNHDGHEDNRSWNSGHEGPTEDLAIREIRRRRSRALLATLLLSRGVPMMLGGDELGRTQGGNNNAYAIDAPSSWYDWSSADHADLVRAATSVRARHPALRSERYEPWDWRTPEGHPIEDVPGPSMASIDKGLLVAFNPTDGDVVIDLPEGEWKVELSSSGAHSRATLTDPMILPAWTVLVISEDVGRGG